MRPLWLLEAGVYAEAVIEPLKRELRRQGMAHGVIHYDGFASGYLDRVGGHRLSPDDCVIFYGTWPLWRHIQLHWPWVPGGWCSAENLDCACYYLHFGPYLLNRHHAILPGVDAIQRCDELFDRFGHDDRVFVRPTGCVKLFAGRCVDRAGIATALAPARYDPATQVVVAGPRAVGREWRLVICEGEPIAASQYLDAGEKRLAAGCPAEVMEFVRTMLGAVAWRPDDVFMLDVCEAEGGLHLLELNGFSCAALYRCDLAAVVARTSALAARLWRAKHAAG
jgi:hypothetical protein